MRSSVPAAYSNLPAVLERCRLGVPELRVKLEAAGVHVNEKSLYRLTTAEPLLKIDTRIVGAICQLCAVGIQEIISFEPPKFSLQKLSDRDQERLDELMSRHNDGELSPAEIAELDVLSEKAHALTLANARKLSKQRRALRTARNPLANRRRR